MNLLQEYLSLNKIDLGRDRDIAKTHYAKACQSMSKKIDCYIGEEVRNDCKSVVDQAKKEGYLKEKQK